MELKLFSGQPKKVISAKIKLIKQFDFTDVDVAKATPGFKGYQA